MKMDIILLLLRAELGVQEFKKEACKKVQQLIRPTIKYCILRN
jgi:hypothetical protein